MWTRRKLKVIGYTIGIIIGVLLIFALLFGLIILIDQLDVQFDIWKILHVSAGLYLIYLLYNEVDRNVK